MLKNFENYSVKLSGTLIMIYDNLGNLLKAKEASHPVNAVDEFNQICLLISKK